MTTNGTPLIPVNDETRRQRLGANERVVTDLSPKSGKMKTVLHTGAIPVHLLPGKGVAPPTPAKAPPLPDAIAKKQTQSLPKPLLSPPLPKAPIRCEFHLVPLDEEIMPRIIIGKHWIIMGRKPFNPMESDMPRVNVTLPMEYLSSLHASVIEYEGQVTVCDLNSRNGSWLFRMSNQDYEQLTSEPVNMYPGDRLVLTTEETSYTLVRADIISEIYYDGHEASPTETQHLLTPVVMNTDIHVAVTQPLPLPRPKAPPIQG